MTVGQAARVLAVGPRQVRRLVGAGELVASGRVGGSLLVDAGSVHRLARRGSERGRPWDERTAWAAIDLLGGGETVRVPASQRSRLRSKLRSMDAEQVVRNGRRRAVAARYRAQPSLLLLLRDDLALTGSCAVAADGGVAARFGLASGGGSTLDGYVNARTAEQVRDRGFLVPDAAGNVTLRVTDAPREWSPIAEDALIAIDLAGSLDPRSRSAGIEFLHRCLESL